MKKLRLGVVGIWGRGAIAEYAHQSDGNSLIVAGADPYQESHERFTRHYREKYPETPFPQLYHDYREMIEKENLDGVFVTSPDFLHEEQAVFALEHKVAVYLEKPIAITLTGADRILETAYRNRTKLILGHNMRYMAFTRKMKEIIDSGTIGKVKAIWCRHFISYGGDAYFRDWHADSKYSNSLLLQKGAHDLDIIHWFAGSISRCVSGFGNLSVYDKLPRRPAGEERLKDGIASVWKTSHWPPDQQKDMYPAISVNDLNMISMKLCNGVLACYLQCHYTPDSSRNYCIIGTHGRMENYGHDQIQVWTHRTDDFKLDGDITYRIPVNNDGHGGSDPLIIQSFVDALQNKFEVWSSAQAARYGVAAGCLGADSIRQGKLPLDIPQLPKHLENFDFTRGTPKILKEKSC